MFRLGQLYYSGLFAFDAGVGGYIWVELAFVFDLGRLMIGLVGYVLGHSGWYHIRFGVN